MAQVIDTGKVKFSKEVRNTDLDFAERLENFPQQLTTHAFSKSCITGENISFLGDFFQLWINTHLVLGRILQAHDNICRVDSKMP